MNIRNLLLAASLAVVSSAAFAGKAPTTLGGFQSTGSVVVPSGVVVSAGATKAADAARTDKDAVDESKKEEK